MRTFDPIKLDEYALIPFLGTDECAYCVGHGFLLVGKKDGEWICQDCHQKSRKRTFAVFMHGGDDIMCDDLPTLERAMVTVCQFLEDPDEYGRYAPFLILAQNEWGLPEERVATIDMPLEDKNRSRVKHGYPPIKYSITTQGKTED
jgi:hypothetical protein